MFRQKIYKEPNNSLADRLEHLYSKSVNYGYIKFYNINSNAWITINTNNAHKYKIQKEVLINNNLIFYVYLESYNEES